MINPFGMKYRNNTIAVVDVRSYNMTVVVFDPGVNNTFVVKSRETDSYSGYAEGDFLDVSDFKKVASDLIKKTILTVSKPIKKFYVGVPGEFLKISEAQSVVSLGSARRITAKDLDEVIRRARPKDTDKYATVLGSSVCYTLSDDRKSVNPVGETSGTIKADLCFYRVKRTFVSIIENIFNETGFKFEIELIPTLHAEAMYLMSSEKRETYNVLFDFGYISSTYSIVYGNGVLYSESFSIGAGHIAYYIMECLNLPYGVACALMDKVNLNVSESDPDENSFTENIDIYYNNSYYSVPADILRERIREALDLLCESIYECSKNSKISDLCGKNFYMTGESVNAVRGLCEHVAARLEKNVIEIVPQLPCYDRPECASLVSLMYAAIKT